MVAATAGSAAASSCKLNKVIDDTEYDIFNVHGKNMSNTHDTCVDFQLGNNDKYFVDVNLNNQDVKFEVDTGAAVTCVGENIYRKFCKPEIFLQSTDLI